MACDVWNQVIAAGINAEIAVGNIEKHSYTKTYEYKDINHAWVLAEVSPNVWIAIECTAGRTIGEEENKLYYHPYICFQNPKQLHSFNDLSKQITLQEQRYDNAVNHYNKLVDVYNSSNSIARLAMYSALEQAKQQYLIEDKELLQLIDERNSLTK